MASAAEHDGAHDGSPRPSGRARRSPSYLYLVDVREGGKAKQQMIANLGLKETVLANPFGRRQAGHRRRHLLCIIAG